jgi:hypothetical protein
MTQNRIPVEIDERLVRHARDVGFRTEQTVSEVVEHALARFLLGDLMDRTHATNPGVDVEEIMELARNELRSYREERNGDQPD